MAMEDDEECAPSTSEPDKLAVLQTAIKQGPSFFQAIDVKLRPIVPFINRPKLSRNLRQKCLDKLTGQHLALAAALADSDKISPETAASDETLVDQCIASAIEQETDIYNRCASGALYQNLAARSTGLDWRNEVRAAAEAEKAYDTLLQTQKQQELEENEPRAKKKARIDNNTNNSNNAMDKQGVGAMSSKNGAPSDSGPHGNASTQLQHPAAPSLALVEADLEWDKATTATDDDKEVRRRVLNILEGCSGWKGLTTEERVTATNRCTDKIAGKPCTDEALQKLTSEYVKFLIKKRKSVK